MIQDITTPIATVAAIGAAMKNYADYNFWANATLVKWLRTKSPELLEQEVASSFPSIKLTLLHIWQTQQYWLAMIKREEPASLDFEGSVQDVLEGLVDHSEEMAEYIRTMNDERMEECTLIVSPWFQCDFQNFEYIIQVFNHSTYHRGQVTSIGRQLGFTDAPMTDYNYYNIYGK